MNDKMNVISKTDVRRIVAKHINNKSAGINLQKRVYWLIFISA